MSPTIPREGTLSNLHVCELLAGLSSEGVTGILHLSGGRPEKSVFFREGRIIFAASQDPADRLGELLVARGVITRAQQDEAGRRLSPGKRLGTVLVELGFLPAQDLPRWVLEQVKEILFSTFSWTEGTFRFESGSIDSSEVIRLRLSLVEIVLKGVRRIEKWSILRPDTAGIRIPFRLAPGHSEILKEVSLSDEQKSLLSLLRSHGMSMEEASRTSSLSTLLVYQLFFAFRVLGWVVPAGTKDESAGPPPEVVPSGLPGEVDPGATIRLVAPLSRLAGQPAPDSPVVSEPQPPSGAREIPGEEEQVAESNASLGGRTVMIGPPAPPFPAEGAREKVAPEPEASGASPAHPAEPISTPVPPPRRKEEYRVVRVEADKLNGNGAKQIEEILGIWSRKGYRLAGVVSGKPGGLFGSSTPSFFIFARD